jgi:hypothetical protein
MQSRGLWVLLLLLSPILRFAQKADRWLISCGPESAINENTSEAGLREIFGDAVQRKDIDIGEGETEPGTLVFGSDPKRAISIIWRDPQTRLHPKWVKLISVSQEGSSAEKNLWHTANGISLGTSLRTAEQINGKSFKLLGFEFDGSGHVTSWDGGKLAEANTATCSLNLNFGPENTTSEAVQNLMVQVSGDTEFSSAHPAMQKLNPKVDLIEIEFHAPVPQGRKQHQ